MKTKSIVALVIGSLLITFCPLVEAEDSEDITIENDSYHYISFDMGLLDKVDFSYITSGPPVDMLFMNESFFKLYTSSVEIGLQSMFFYYPEHSSMNSTSGSFSFRTFIPGTYFVVLDNTDYNKKGAGSQGLVKVSINSEHWINPISMVEAGVLAATFVVLIIIFIRWRYNSSKRKYKVVPKMAPIVIKRTVVRRTVVGA